MSIGKKGDVVLNVQIIDIHSHILPQVDDGCRDISQSVSVLKAMESIGVTDVFLTPHYCKRRGHVATPDAVKEAYELLCLKAKEEEIAINLRLGTEMEYSQDGARYIREGRINTLNGTKYLLVEFPPYISPDTLLLWSREIISMGLVPVVAHIERYKEVIRDEQCVVSLKQMGALIQVNIRSCCSHGFGIHRFLKWLISNRYADFLGGDVHLYPIEPKEINKCKKLVVRYSDEDYLRKLLSENAKKYLLRQG